MNMGLSADIRDLQSRALLDLAFAHDYYTDTKNAWKFVRRALRGGKRLAIRNRVTGTKATTEDVAEKAREYVAGQLAEVTFSQFVAICENSVFDLLRLWLCAYPQSLAAKKISFATVLEASDIEAITLQVVNHELNELAYMRPREWFKYLNERVHLGCPELAQIERFEEIKASRDVIVHNRGVVNQTYLRKSGVAARCRLGESISIPEDYHRESWQFLRQLLIDVLTAAETKAAPEISDAR